MTVRELLSNIDEVYKSYIMLHVFDKDNYYGEYKLNEDDLKNPDVLFGNYEILGLSFIERVFVITAKEK